MKWKLRFAWLWLALSVLMMGMMVASLIWPEMFYSTKDMKRFVIMPTVLGIISGATIYEHYRKTRTG
jgi:hypothetical protein